MQAFGSVQGERKSAAGKKVQHEERNLPASQEGVEKECLLSDSEVRTISKHMLQYSLGHESIRTEISSSLALTQSGTVRHLRLRNAVALQGFLRTLLKNLGALHRSAYQSVNRSFRESRFQTEFSTDLHNAAAKNICGDAEFDEQLAGKNPDTELFSETIKFFKKDERYFELLSKAVDKKDARKILKIAHDMKKSVGVLLDLLQSPKTCKMDITDLAPKQVRRSSPAIEILVYPMILTTAGSCVQVEGQALSPGSADAEATAVIIAGPGTESPWVAEAVPAASTTTPSSPRSAGAAVATKALSAEAGAQVEGRDGCCGEASGAADAISVAVGGGGGRSCEVQGREATMPVCGPLL